MVGKYPTYSHRFLLLTLVLFTALGTLFAVSLRPRFANLFLDNNDISEAIKAGLRVLGKVANINSILKQCNQYFTKLQALAEARATETMALTEPHQIIPEPLPHEQVQEQDSVEALNARIFGEWDDFSGIADVFSDSLLPEFDAGFFSGF
jgi:hypothetical protein